MAVTEAVPEQVYSQNNEDGLIARILDVLPVTDRWCVEIGAYDGKTYSNTRRLIEEKGYKAVWFEPDAVRFRQLSEDLPASVEAIPEAVGFTLDDNLDHHLSDTFVPPDFDFLSIDIDGCDYHVWKAIHLYRPKLVCIEFNPTIPNEIAYVQAQDPKVMIGASIGALVELGKEKKYELIACTSFNAFFIEQTWFRLFDPNNDFCRLREDMSFITFMFQGYDGTIHYVGNMQMPWHGIPITPFQVLPRVLQKYPAHYTRFERAYAQMWYFMHVTMERIGNFMHKVWNKLP